MRQHKSWEIHWDKEDFPTALCFADILVRKLDPEEPNLSTNSAWAKSFDLFQELSFSVLHTIKSENEKLFYPSIIFEGNIYFWIGWSWWFLVWAHTYLDDGVHVTRGAYPAGTTTTGHLADDVEVPEGDVDSLTGLGVDEPRQVDRTAARSLRHGTRDVAFPGVDPHEARETTVARVHIQNWKALPTKNPILFHKIKRTQSPPLTHKSKTVSETKRWLNLIDSRTKSDKGRDRNSMKERNTKPITVGLLLQIVSELTSGTLPSWLSMYWLSIIFLHFQPRQIQVTLPHIVMVR